MLLTRCPSCGTSFRVTPEQLKARAGKVRCGQCQGVFNALESLQDAPTVVETPCPAAEAPAATAPAGETAAEPAAVADGVPPATADAAAEPASVAAGSVDVLLENIPAAEKAGAVPSAAAAYAWGAAGVLALVLLLGQLVYVFRAELALAWPQWRPRLEEFCRQFECEIPLPRKADLVGIEASELHPDPQRQSLLALSATLKNHAAFAQEYPHLEVTLTDTQDRPMIRRVFAPAEYLAEGADVHAGFPANGDVAVNLWLDAGEIGASGYRLYLFYP